MKQKIDILNAVMVLADRRRIRLTTAQVISINLAVSLGDQSPEAILDAALA